MSAKPSTSAPQFSLEDVVRKRVNKEAIGIVTGLIYRPHAVVLYLISWGDSSDEIPHYACELVKDEECVEKAN